MMVFTIISILLLTPLLWVIFTPILLYMDTDLNRYEVNQGWPWSISIHPDQSFKPDFKIFGIRVPIHRTTKAATEKKEKSANKRRLQKKTRIPMHARLSLIKKLARCFTLQKLELTFDTNDVVLNAQLIPIALFVSNGPAQITPNFTGHNYLHLEMMGYPYKIIWTLSKFFIKTQIQWK